MNVRKSNINDCKAIAHIVTLAWNETYKGIINDSFLKSLEYNEEKRISGGEQEFTNKDIIQYVAEEDGQIVGFIKLRPSTENKLEKCGEIQALYLLNKYKRKGYGKILFETGINELKNIGYEKAIVGCIKENPSNKFYKKMGGNLIKTRKFELQDQVLTENVYLYENI